MFSQEDSSTARKYGGTGLGLSITNHLLKQMNSKLELQSKFGIGTCFSFQLEMESTNSLTETNTKDSNKLQIDDLFQMEKSLSSIQTKILIVDDNEINLTLLRAMLQRIIPKAKIIEAISITKNENPDIIFMDIQMPKSNGFDATLKICENEIPNKKNTIIVALTAGESVHEKEKCFQMGFNDFISKPVVLKTISSCLSKFLLK